LCLIIDACVAAEVFAVPCGSDHQPIWDWLKSGGRIVFGGLLTRELNAIVNVRKRLLELWRAGVAHQVPDEAVESEERKVRATGLCRSQDTHVLALALASGTRILCTNDAALETDFKNPRLIPRPRGRVYKRAAHRRLLGHNSICLGRPRSRHGRSRDSR